MCLSFVICEMRYDQYLLYKVVLRIRQVGTHKTLGMALDGDILSAQDMLAAVLSTCLSPEGVSHRSYKGFNGGLSPPMTKKRCLGDKCWEEMLQVPSLCRCQHRFCETAPCTGRSSGHLQEEVVPVGHSTANGGSMAGPRRGALGEMEGLAPITQFCRVHSHPPWGFVLLCDKESRHRAP